MTLHTCNVTSPRPFPFARSLLRWLFALAFAFAGYKHITAPDGFVAITPHWVPRPDFVVWATGWCEIAGAAGFLFPKRWSPRAYRAASSALAIYALCVWPANFNHALHDIPVAGVHLSWWYHGPRLAFQPVLIWALLWAGHIIDWPFGRPHAVRRCADLHGRDADHARPVLHEAQAEGTIAGRNAACFPNVVPGRRMVPFSIMFTDPPLANIGKLDGKDSVIASASYEDQGRAKVEGVNRGLARLHADPANGKLIGAVLATPAAEHMAHFLVMAIDRGLTASEILTLPFYHPTFEEGLKPALREICLRTGGPVAMERDDGFLAGA